jgi:hypothetical protein
MRLKEIHPLVHGLVRVLPAPGKVMTGDQQQDWLDCAASILALLYLEPQSLEAAAVARHQGGRRIRGRRPVTVRPLNAGAEGSEARRRRYQFRRSPRGGR